MVSRHRTRPFEAFRATWRHSARLVMALLLTSIVGATGCDAQTPRRAAVGVDTSLAATVARLSEPGGFFDSDNLISNETSYLHVVPRLQQLGVRGGAYVGVGPDQNYSYIATIRPVVAYIIDVRRDNMLQHLTYKALFARSLNRVEYLSRWLGRPVPRNSAQWSQRSIDDILTYVDTVTVDDVGAARERREVLLLIEGYGIPLTAADRATLNRYLATFASQSLNLRFESIGRGNAAQYPTLRRIILETDGTEKRVGYLVNETDWQFVKQMHADNRIIPVVGDLGGTRAMRALGDEMRQRNVKLTAFYTSNAEQYVWSDGGFGRLAESVLQWPADSVAVIIRSIFNRGGSHPMAVPGHRSAQTLQRVSDFRRRWTRGEIRTYWDLVTLDAK